MSKGDAEHTAGFKHGVQHRVDPPAPQTVEQRLAKLEQIVVEIIEKIKEKVEQVIDPEA
jgi:hypothetical protein